VHSALAAGRTDNGVFAARIVWGTLDEVIGKLATVYPDLIGEDVELLRRALLSPLLSAQPRSSGGRVVPSMALPTAYSSPPGRCLGRLRTAATAQIVSTISTSRGNTRLFELWDTTWVTFPPAVA